MADLKIDEAKAVAWVQDVQNKLSAVEGVLREVRAVRNESVGSNDTVFQLIEKAGNLMEETWTNTCNSFKKGWSVLQEGLGVIGKAGKAIGEAFEELQKKI